MYICLKSIFWLLNIESNICKLHLAAWWLVSLPHKIKEKPHVQNQTHENLAEKEPIFTIKSAVTNDKKPVNSRPLAWGERLTWSFHWSTDDQAPLPNHQPQAADLEVPCINKDSSPAFSSQQSCFRFNLNCLS